MTYTDRYVLTKIGEEEFNYLEYREIGIQGVGKNHIPIVNMDPYINHDMDDDIHVEICKGLTYINSYDPGRFSDPIPPEVMNNMGGNVYTVMLSHLDSIDKDGRHRKALEEISRSQRRDKTTAMYRYCYYALGAFIPWYFVVSLTSSNDHSHRQYFPKLLEYIKSLPFSTTHRIVIFATYPNTGVIMHRDRPFNSTNHGPAIRHKTHSINLFFSDSRPTFIYDEIKKEKVYLEKGAKSCFFNSRDFHGVDPEPVFRYTVRVDGTFNDDMIDILQLENGYV